MSVFVPPQRAPVMPGFAIDQCSRPPGSSVSSSFAFVATMNLPNGDHEALPYAPSRRLEPSGSTTQGPRAETASTWPWAGSENSDGCAFLTPTTFSRPIASRTPPSTARPGGVIAAAITTTAAAATATGQRREIGCGDGLLILEDLAHDRPAAPARLELARHDDRDERAADSGVIHRAAPQAGRGRGGAAS